MVDVVVGRMVVEIDELVVGEIDEVGVVEVVVLDGPVVEA